MLVRPSSSTIAAAAKEWKLLINRSRNVTGALLRVAIIKLHEQRAVSRCAFWCPRALYCQLTSFFWLEDQVWQHSLLLCIIKQGALSCCPSPKSAELRLSPSVQSDSKTSCLIPGEWCGYESCIVNGCFILLKYFTWTSLRISGNKFGNLSISYGKALSQSFFLWKEARRSYFTERVFICYWTQKM